MRDIRSKILVSLFIATLSACVRSPTISPDVATLPLLNDAQKIAVTNWLSKNPNFRVGTEKDCDCDDDIRFTREKGPFGSPLPTYEPYISIGDFNDDGRQDFAIVAVNVREPNTGILLIFNGSPGTWTKGPSFATAVNPILRTTLIQSYKVHKLLYGPFESEACLYQPKGDTYVEDCAEDD